MRASKAEATAAFDRLADGLEAFSRDLPDGVARTFKRTPDHVDFEMPSRSRRHRRLVVSGSAGGLEYELGKLWTENMACDANSVVHVLAACDAVIAGRVREVRDLQTGLLYHVYRLKTRGLNKFVQDSEYCLMHYLRLKVRRVRIHRIPSLAAA